MPKGFHLLIAAQFCSALADNALLIVAIGLLAARGDPAWWAPLLKFGLTIAYVVLAPFVGPLADAFPKARLMACMNAVKAFAIVLVMAGLHPVAGLIILGIGAAAYAPAKYGLLTEVVPSERLVAANGWIEVSVVLAVLLGTVAGGALVSPLFMQSALNATASLLAHPLTAPVHASLSGALVILLGMYGAAALLNLGVPESGAHYPRASIHPVHLWREFVRANLTLWRDPDGGLSMAATTLFWGTGAALQFALLAWAGQHLGLRLDQAAYLQAAVAVGVVAGAMLAATVVPMAGARRVLVVGILLGLLIPAAASVTGVMHAALLLAAVGAAGGFLVVPLNALLQHRGCTLLTAGRSIAVQGFNENLGILVMLAVYASLISADIGAGAVMSAIGIATATATGALIISQRPTGKAPSRW